MTLLEVLVATAVTVVALTMVTQIVVAAAGQRTVSRDNALASNGARMAVERMRNVPFDEVYALYNANPDDDPLGPGTAPGSLFAIEGLVPVEGQVAVGRIELPTLAIQEPDGSVRIELREDAVDPHLDLPRDLNGDSIVDDVDHSGDYHLLPFRITVEWESSRGPRRMDLYTMMTEMRK